MTEILFKVVWINQYIYIHHFREHVEEIVNLWHTLLSQTETKGNKLTEASQQQQFNRSIEDVEGWLHEIEGQLKSEDYGKVKKKGG